MRVDEIVLYQQELQRRETELEKGLKDWDPRGGEQSFAWYRRYVESGFVALPYPGGWANQPVWWIDDVDMFDLKSELYWIPTELKHLQEHLKGLTKRG